MDVANTMNILNIALIGTIVVSVGLVVREVRALIREFEMRLVKVDGRWFVEML